MHPLCVEPFALLHPDYADKANHPLSQGNPHRTNLILLFNLTGVLFILTHSMRQCGGALGAAVLGGVLTTRYVENLIPDMEKYPQPLVHEAKKSSTAVRTATQADYGYSGEFLDMAARAFVEAMRETMTVAAMTCLVGAGVAFALFPRDTECRTLPRGTDEWIPDTGAQS